jgi:hypothetical protein
MNELMGGKVFISQSVAAAAHTAPDGYTSYDFHDHMSFPLVAVLRSPASLKDDSDDAGLQA